MSLRIVFMGTPDFAVESLKALYENNYNIVGVITAPDKPAGRGRKLNESAVKKYAKEQNLNILQPTNLKSEEFLEELKALEADLQIVVAFRMLPEVVWNMPKMGTFNLHGSLLPQYRGAAPLNWAIINGEKKTGVTTFFLNHNIDTGDIIDFRELEIKETDNVESIHDQLMVIGSNLVVETVKQIEIGEVKSIPQAQVIKDELKHAPKIFKEDCKIDFTQNLERIFNHIRGLSPYPAAFINLKDDDKELSMKIFATEKIEGTNSNPIIESDNKTFIHLKFSDGALKINELQISGKRRMKTEDFLRGYNGDLNKVEIIN
jgi:methionyl-tRNA formyltransferase